jgi:hypothetical protein
VSLRSEKKELVPLPGCDHPAHLYPGPRRAWLAALCRFTGHNPPA